MMRGSPLLIGHLQCGRGLSLSFSATPIRRCWSRKAVHRRMLDISYVEPIVFPYVSVIGELFREFVIVRLNVVFCMVVILCILEFYPDQVM